MTFKIAVITIVYLGSVAAQTIPIKRQVGLSTSLTEKEDNVPAETGFANPAAAVHQGSKFFQYIHVPAKDHVEHGHKRGNDHHFIERHEKEHPHAGEFRTKRDSGYDYNDSRSQSYRQFRDPDDYIDGFRGGFRDDFRDGYRDGFRVGIRDRFRNPLPLPAPRRSVISIPIVQRPVRWGDKHGGYGEHYWDYNHGGHGNDGDGGESQHNEEYAEYEEESKPQAAISPVEDILRNKREPVPSGDVEFISDRARSLILDGKAQKHGGNYRAVNDYRGKREQATGRIRAQPQSPRTFGESLTFDADQGLVVDEETGVRYQLNPIR